MAGGFSVLSVSKHTRRLVVYVDVDVAAEIARRAQLEGRSVSAQLASLIAEALPAAPDPEPPAPAHSLEALRPLGQRRARRLADSIKGASAAVGPSLGVTVKAGLRAGVRGIPVAPDPQTAVSPAGPPRWPS